jgi:hypothetical protein
MSALSPPTTGEQLPNRAFAATRGPSDETDPCIIAGMEGRAALGMGDFAGAWPIQPHADCRHSWFYARLMALAIAAAKRGAAPPA